jgi:hypothetical protein
LTANVAQLSVEDGADMNDASRTNVINAAKALMDEHARGEKFHPLASVLQIGSIGVAYAVQHEYGRLQKPFCQGEAGAVGSSRMPMARNRRVATLP